MKSILRFAAPLALIAAPAPLLAQDAPDEEAEVMSEDMLAGMMGALAGMFASEPLTAEEEGRLPAATALVDKIVPAGTMGEMMSGMFDGMLGPIMAMGEADAKGPLAKLLGVSSASLAEVDEAQAARALAMLDPDWQLRREREAEALPRAMNGMMVAMEPTLKSAMSEMYAIYFDAGELADIDAFFSTPSGTAYARKSFSMSADPRFAGAMMQAMPAVLSGIGTMQETMEAATADLATPREWGQLEVAEKDKLADAIGLARGDIEAMTMGWMEGAEEEF